MEQLHPKLDPTTSFEEKQEEAMGGTTLTQ
jgi:hypothetical protein